jgi:hypothetical protein
MFDSPEVAMSQRNGCLFAAVVMVVLLPGCAAKRPVLYPNHAYQRAGDIVVQQDIDACLADAQAYGAGTSAAAQTAGSTAVGAATGAAVGAATGAVWGRPGRGAGRGAAAGAAGGAVGGFLRGIFRSRRPDPIEARYVSICLGSRGYQVIGWN